MVSFFVAIFLNPCRVISILNFGLAILDWRFWIGDFGLLIPEFAGLPAIESLALFPRIDIMPLC